MLLEANAVHRFYSNDSKSLHVLRGINLKIEEGRFIAIVGPSGAGKSTLLHILGGLDKPSQGSVFFQDKDIHKLSDQELSTLRNLKIGFVFQFYHLLSEFNVLENVMMPALIGCKVSRSQGLKLKQKALELLDRVGLKERVTHFPAELSGGEKQRVALVRSLINKPSLLLCDEPTGNLDSKTGSDIADLIKKLNREEKMTVVLVTHNLELAAIADRVHNLRDGVLVS
jgi:lipoprotein-releasing system ATP-binding protein